MGRRLFQQASAGEAPRYLYATFAMPGFVKQLQSSNFESALIQNLNQAGVPLPLR